MDSSISSKVILSDSVSGNRCIGRVIGSRSSCKLSFGAALVSGRAATDVFVDFVFVDLEVSRIYKFEYDRCSFCVERVCQIL